MPEKVKLISNKIQYKGDFEITKVYDFVRDWLKDRGYLIIEEKNIMEPLTKTEVVRVEWAATREITDYFKAEIKLKFFVDPSETIKQNGERIVKGSFSLSVSGYLVYDYRKQYKDKKVSTFRTFWRAAYDKFVIGDRREKVEKMIREDSEELLSQTRAFLGMER